MLADAVGLLSHVCLAVQFGHLGVVGDFQTVDRPYGDAEKTAARKVCQHLLAMDSANPGLEGTSRPYDAAKLQEAHKEVLSEDFVFDESQTVGQLLTDSGLQLGGFVRVNLGGENSAH